MGSLTIKDFQKRANTSELEQAVLEYWDKTNAFEQSIAIRKDSKRYVFYDGPPFATGLPHYGHILASTIKDVVPRYFTMKGFRVDRVWGWDCHGIPIENIVEKELDLKGGKKGIEALGIDKFNAACKAAILRFDKEWEIVIRRIGRWVDFKHSYKTMDKTYMESVWWAFKSLNEKGRLYEGRKVILYCPRCSTPLSNFEIAMDNSYKDIDEPSTTYKFPIAGQEKTFILAWSTTPWNKLATTALAVNPDLTYVYAKQGNETYILAESRLAMLSDKPYTIEKKVKGKELHGVKFVALYDFYPKRTASEKAFIIVADEYVSDAEGTGVVTLAAYGEEDYRVMKLHNIQCVEHVDSEGKLKPEVTPWAGVYILKANPLIDEDLEKRGLIYAHSPITHSVPTCYRCSTRLYYAPVPAWFIDIQTMKKDLIKSNESINWYPEHLKHGRFGKGLETAPDWNISRSRYWGTPMPIWKSKDGQMRIIGSLEELKKYAVNPKEVEKLTDIHREFLDGLEVWVDEAKTIKGKRIPEVFDCWVESGSMPYASLHYPFEHKKEFESSHPAQFIAEYIAQTRAWFYTLHVMSVGLFGNNTFENAVTTGTILASDGTKMSKSKKNFPDPAIVFERYGVDALRFYLMKSVVMNAENLNFSENEVKDIHQRLISTVWNVFAFYKLYAPDDIPVDDMPKAEHILDQWIISKTNRLVRDTGNAFDRYEITEVCKNIQEYVTELSTWYLRRSRDRISSSVQARQVFGWTLATLSKVMAPVTPFIAELMFTNMYADKSSVHHELWPSFDEGFIDDTLENEMSRARIAVTEGLAKRKNEQLPVRTPLREMVLSMTGDFGKIRDGVWEIVLEELNVKNLVVNSDVRFPKTPVIVTDKELQEEGAARDLIRSIQQMRKGKGLRFNDEITLTLPATYKTLSAEKISFVKKETLVHTLLWDNGTEISIG
jgi:isoleucyl-tRNA synthetase